MERNGFVPVTIDEAELVVIYEIRVSNWEESEKRVRFRVRALRFGDGLRSERQMLREMGT